MRTIETPKGSMNGNKDQRSETGDAAVDGGASKLSVTDFSSTQSASSSRPIYSAITTDQSEKKHYTPYGAFATDQSSSGLATQSASSSRPIYGAITTDQSEKKHYTPYSAFATDQSSSGLDWVPPPRKQPVERKCDICGGNHYSCGCSYRMSVPPDTPIINSRDYVIVCQCGGDFVSGLCCNCRRPGITGRVVNRYTTLVTFSVDRLPPQDPISASGQYHIRGA